MQNLTEQKVKLAQKKNRLLAEETKLKLLERKARTRQLIELGGLVSKAGLAHLSLNSLYGGLLSLASSLETNRVIKEQWTNLGKEKLAKEQIHKHAVILKFATQPTSELRNVIRQYGLKWNKLRAEWYGMVVATDVDALQLALSPTPYQIEIL